MSTIYGLMTAIKEYVEMRQPEFTHLEGVTSTHMEICGQVASEKKEVLPNTKGEVLGDTRLQAPPFRTE